MGLRDYLTGLAGDVLANAQQSSQQSAPNAYTRPVPVPQPLDVFAQVALQSNPAILNQNYNFTTSVTPWTAQSGATLQQSSVWSFQGGDAYSALFFGNGVTAGPEIASESTIPVTAGNTFTASAECYSPQGWSEVFMLINWYTASGAYISTSTGPFVNVPANVIAGTLISYTTTAPATAAFAQFFIQMAGTPASTVLMYASLVQFNPGSSPSNGMSVAAVASIGPQVVKQYWSVESVSVGTNQAPGSIVNDANLQLFLGTTPNVGSGQLIGTSRTGSSGDSIPGGGQLLKPGYLLIAQWVAGDPGVTAVMRVLGTYQNGIS
jgi:hypothetical protein